MSDVAPKAHAIRRPWTAEEDIKLCEAITRHGSRQWKLICQAVPTRDHIQCLQRWQKVLDPSLRKGFWSRDEDALLVSLKVAADAAAPPGRVPSWGCISKSIVGRNPKQCRERWNNFLDPTLNMGPWTPEEDQILYDGWNRFGSSWSTIAKLLKGRTQTKIRDRWKFLTSATAKRRRAEGAAASGQGGAPQPAKQERQPKVQQPSPPPEQQQPPQQQHGSELSPPTACRKRKATSEPGAADAPADAPADVPVTPRFSESCSLASRRAFSAAQDPSMSPPLDALSSASDEQRVPHLRVPQLGGRAGAGTRRGKARGGATLGDADADALAGAALPRKYSARTADNPDEATAAERRLRVQAAAAAMQDHRERRVDVGAEASGHSRGKAKQHTTWLQPRSSRQGAAPPKGAVPPKGSIAARGRAPQGQPRAPAWSVPPLPHRAVSRLQGKPRRPRLRLPRSATFEPEEQDEGHRRPTVQLLHIDPDEFGLPALRANSPDSSEGASEGSGSGAFSQLCIGLATDSTEHETVPLCADFGLDFDTSLESLAGEGLV